MILTVDLGNSNLVTVLYDDGANRLDDDRRDTIKEESYARYRDYFQDVLDLFGHPQITAVTTSCVVPYLRNLLREVVRDVFPEAKHFQLQYSMVPELDIRLSEPREIGADLIATAYGALGKYDQPTIIADMGSATKLTVVDRPEVFLGGIIMPGVAFQAKSLHLMIPHLPKMTPAKPEKVIGYDTMTSIQSGIVNGSLAAITELAKKIEQEIDQDCQWVITGGIAKLYSPEDLAKYRYDEFLLSDGLCYLTLRWLDKN
ncbi:MAG TPA: type III pantothenate kinase [Tissierellia bacterium]|nr:type III pantothenate kinase [Tissierellia bacterium]